MIRVLLVLLLLPGTLSAEVIQIFGDRRDGSVDVVGNVGDIPFTGLRAGVHGNDARGVAPVFIFALPESPIVSAELQLWYNGAEQFTELVRPEFAASLFGLTPRTVPQFGGFEYYNRSRLLQRSLVTPTTPEQSWLSADVTGYVSQAINFGFYGDQGYALFLLAPDIDLPPGSFPYRGYGFGSGDNEDGFRPVLVVTTAGTAPIPEPTGLVLLAIGMLCTLYLVRR